MAKAYLNVELDVHPAVEMFMAGADPGLTPPTLKGVRIHSSPPGSLSVGVWACLFEAEAETYHEAEDEIIRVVEYCDAFIWARPWVRRGMEAHMHRFELQQKLELSGRHFFGNT